jgi:hypothetical protein
LNVIGEKLKEVLAAVLPVYTIVVIIILTATEIARVNIAIFSIGAFLIIIGLTLFLFGVDLGITPVGNLMGSAIAKRNKISVLVISGIILGFLISIAEPDLHILAGQITDVTSGAIPKFLMITVVSIGIALMLSLGLIRIVYNLPLYIILIVLYGIILVLSFFTSSEFLAISFDASGSTTGALTVPFILALSVGISNLKKDGKSSEKDSFGLVAIASTGAVISVMIMGIVKNVKHVSGALPLSESNYPSIIYPFIQKTPIVIMEVVIALSPLLAIFLFFQMTHFKLPKRALSKILKGFVYSFIGLVFFLVGVNAGFMKIGSMLGNELALSENYPLIIIFGFILGMTTILAEPAVHVLTHQIEEVTIGYVRGKIVLYTLSLGIGVAIALSIIRILVPPLQLWHYLLPGYIIAVILTFFTPKLFVGIAFDSGGVASGPMTATFILAFIQGIANAKDGADVLADGFGMIAMVALTPLIALQLLGLVFKSKSKKEGVKEDEQNTEPQL